MRGLLLLRGLFFSLFLGVFLVFCLVVESNAQGLNVGRYYTDQGGKRSSVFGYYKDDGKRGWWWYEDPVKKEEEEKRVEAKKEVKKEEAKKEEEKKEEVKKEEKAVAKGEGIKPLHEYSYEELLRMPIEEFRKIYEYYKELAVSNPTEENLYYFYNILDVARKKALLFTMQAMYVWQKYPELAEVVRDVPIVFPGLYAKHEEITREVEGYLHGRRGEYGLVVFVSDRCPYCKAQLGILRIFIEQYGWDVKVVNVDYDRKAIAVFGIETVPTIILVSRRTGEWFPLSVGVVSLYELKDRIYLAIRRIEGDLQPGRWGLYRFQEGTSLDPFKPSPLWDKGNKNKPESVRKRGE